MRSTTPQVSRPLIVHLPPWGILFAESIHHSDFKMDWRQDPFHKLIYVLKGSVTAQFRSQEKSTFQFTEGSFIAIDQESKHKILDQIPSTLLLLCFTNSVLQNSPDASSLWRSILSTQSTSLPSSLRNQIENLWRASLWEQQTGQKGSSLMISANTFRILTLLSRFQPQPSLNKSVERVRNISRKLSETFYEEWSIERACHETSLSRRQFCDLFKKVTGRTFLDHLTTLRLDYAASLLSDGKSSIAGTAFSSGFQDLSHFYRLFKQKFGMSPGRWQDRNY
jgi:AraC-like DNA-binding protein